MSGRTKRAAIKGSRLPDETTYDILFLYFCGWPSRQIAQNLDLPIQTIARNIKKIRHKLFSSEDFVLLINEYFWVASNGDSISLSDIRNLYVELHKNALRIEPFGNEMYQCLYHCPTMKPPGEVIAEHFEIFPIDGRFYYMHAKSVGSLNALSHAIRAKNACSICLLKKACQREDDEDGNLETRRILATAEASNFFAYIAFFVSRFRIRNPDDFGAIYEAALVYALWASRLGVQAQDIVGRGGSRNDVVVQFYSDFAGFCARSMNVLGFDGEFPLRLPEIIEPEIG